MYNKVIMMGRLTRDPELKATPNGVSVCKFSIAVDRRFQNKGEEKKADFFNVVAWRQTGEFVSRYFGKGNLILVEGELQTNKFTDKNGNEATWYEIVADRVCFTGEKKSDSGQSNTGNVALSTSAPPPLTPEEMAAIASDNDFPF